MEAKHPLISSAARRVARVKVVPWEPGAEDEGSFPHRAAGPGTASPSPPAAPRWLSGEQRPGQSPGFPAVLPAARCLPGCVCAPSITRSLRTPAGRRSGPTARASGIAPPLGLEVRVGVRQLLRGSQNSRGRVDGPARWREARPHPPPGGTPAANRPPRGAAWERRCECPRLWWVTSTHTCSRLPAGAA